MSPGALLAAKLRGEPVTDEDIARATKAYFDNLGAPVRDIQVGSYALPNEDENETPAK